MVRIVRTEYEIDALLNKCLEAEAEGRTSWPGMSFEEGIKYTIEWLVEEDAAHPLED